MVRRVVVVCLLAAPAATVFACSSLEGLTSTPAVGDAAPDEGADAEASDVAIDAQPTTDADAGGNDCGASTTCAPCAHDCLGGACIGGKCAPVVLATAQFHARNLVSDATRLYWVAGASGRDLFVCEKTGCGQAPRLFATDDGSPEALVGDPGGVSYISAGHPDPTNAFIRRSAAGAPPVTLFDSPYSVGILGTDGTHVFALMQAPDSVRVCPVTGCGGAATTVGAISDLAAIAAIGTTVYATMPLAGALASCPLSGCPQFTTVTALPAVNLASMFTLGTGLLFRSDTGFVRWDPQRPAVFQSIPAAPYGPRAATPAGASVVFTTAPDAGQVLAAMDLSKTAPSPDVLYSGEVDSIVADDVAIYFTQPIAGNIMRLAR